MTSIVYSGKWWCHRICGMYLMTCKFNYSRICSGRSRTYSKLLISSNNIILYGYICVRARYYVRLGVLHLEYWSRSSMRSVSVLNHISPKSSPPSSGTWMTGMPRSISKLSVCPLLWQALSINLANIGSWANSVFSYLNNSESSTLPWELRHHHSCQCHFHCCQYDANQPDMLTVGNSEHEGAPTVLGPPSVTVMILMVARDIK